MKFWINVGFTAWCGVCAVAAARAQTGTVAEATAPSLAETRMLFDKWIETQQVIARERKDWQQGRETLTSRLELARKEAATMEEKVQQAQTAAGEGSRTRDALEADIATLKVSNEILSAAAGRLEGQIRTFFPTLPEPVQAKLKPLFERMPADPGATKVSAAERFQNVLGILSEASKANTELPVLFEVRNLSSGKPAEVRTLYVGLGQAYYLSAGGEAGVGRPSTNGWQWEAADDLAHDVQEAIEIQEGKRRPAFVSLPVVLE